MSEATDVEMLYIAQIEALSAGNTSNWLLSSHSGAYLYAALLHAAPYLQDDPRCRPLTLKANRPAIAAQAFA